MELLGIQHTLLNTDKQCRLQRKCLKESSILLNMYWTHTVNRCWGLAIQTPGEDIGRVLEELMFTVIQTNIACLVNIDF